MSAGPETRLVHRIRAALSVHWPTAYVLKVHGSIYQSAGTPDLLVTVDGLLIGLEVKHRRPHETPARARARTSLVQRSHLRRIVAAGGVAATVISPEEAVRVVQRALARRP